MPPCEGVPSWLPDAADAFLLGAAVLPASRSRSSTSGAIVSWWPAFDSRFVVEGELKPDIALLCVLKLGLPVQLVFRNAVVQSSGQMQTLQPASSCLERVQSTGA